MSTPHNAHYYLPRARPELKAAILEAVANPEPETEEHAE